MGPRGQRARAEGSKVAAVLARPRERTAPLARERAGVCAFWWAVACVRLAGRTGKQVGRLAGRRVGLQHGGMPVGQLAHVSLVPGLSWVGYYWVSGWTVLDWLAVSSGLSQGLDRLAG